MNNEDPLIADPDPTQPVEEQPPVEQKPTKENHKKLPYVVVIIILILLLFGAIGIAVYLFMKPADTQIINTTQRIEQTSAVDFVASVDLRIEQLKTNYPELITTRDESSESIYWYETGEYFVTNQSIASVNLSAYEKPFIDNDAVGNPIYPELSDGFITAAKDLLTTTVFDENNGFTLIPTNDDPTLGSVYQSNLINCTVLFEGQVNLRCNHLEQFSDEDAALYEPFVSAYRTDENAEPIIVSGLMFIETGSNPEVGVYTNEITFGGFRGPTVGSLYYKEAGNDTWTLLTIVATAIPCSTFNSTTLQQIFEGFNCQREEGDSRDNVVLVE